jgi:hypothetical protein
MRRLAIVALLAIAARSPVAAVVLGGGLSDTDCTIGFDGVSATDGASEVVCGDGDPACDADGAVDGSCRFVVRACARLASAGCTPRDISSVSVSGLPLDPPPVGGSERQCGSPDTITVAMGTAVGVTMIARNGTELKDVDYLALCCQVAASPLGAVRCALGLDPSIAGCHRPIPPHFTATLEKARTLVARAANDPTAARAAMKHAARALRRLRMIARKIARSDTCGDALGLWVSETQGQLASLAADSGAIDRDGKRRR